MTWAHTGTAVLAAFLASLVEFVEALTIVLAVGTIRGWRPALTGALAGSGLLAVLVLVFGPALERVPLRILQIAVGVLLLLFGMRWLRKAILRWAGVVGQHDERAVFERETAALRGRASAAGAADAGGAVGAVSAPPVDWVALVTSFKAVVIEGLEVIFIVLATGAGGLILAASLGAAAAGVLVILVAIALRRPLARVPENTLKFAVGILLSAFGVFWLGEGLRFPWPGADLSLLGLVVGFLLASALAGLLARRVRPAGARPPGETAPLSVGAP